MRKDALFTLAPSGVMGIVIPMFIIILMSSNISITCLMSIIVTIAVAFFSFKDKFIHTPTRACQPPLVAVCRPGNHSDAELHFYLFSAFSN